MPVRRLDDVRAARELDLTKRSTAKRLRSLSVFFGTE